MGASKALHMNLFILIAGLLMAPVLLATLVGWICIFWFERKKSWKSRLAKVGLATVPFAFCMWAYAVVFGPLDITEPQALRNAYETALGSPPASDVTDLRCRVSVVGDAGAEWMTFQASPETVDRLLGRYSVISSAEFLDASDGGGAPSWWRPKKADLIAFYRAEGWSPHFSNSTAYVAHDRAKRVVYYHHSGFD